MADLLKENLYAILGVEEDANKKQILTAYRKRALKCHPDKNPDNPQAAAEFHLLSQALEVLSDAAARAAYDKLRQAKAAAELRTRALDSKRRRLKEDLEARERASQEAASDRTTQLNKRTAEERLQAEIHRLRKEGSAILKQEQEMMRKQVHSTTSGAVFRLRLRWDGKQNQQYTAADLERIFSKYGTVDTVLKSTKKPGSALLELQTTSATSKSHLHEVGFPENPLKVLVMDKSEKEEASLNSQSKVTGAAPEVERAEDFEATVMRRLLAAQKAKETESDRVEAGVVIPGLDSQTPSTIVADATNMAAADVSSTYESVHAMNARRASERHRIIEQMIKEEDAS